MDGRTGRDRSGDHRDWQVARWRPQRRQSQAEFAGAGRTRWRPQKGNHEEVDRLSTGLVAGTLVTEQGQDFNGESEIPRKWDGKKIESLELEGD